MVVPMGVARSADGPVPTDDVGVGVARLLVVACRFGKEKAAEGVGLGSLDEIGEVEGALLGERALGNA